MDWVIGKASWVSCLLLSQGIHAHTHTRSDGFPISVKPHSDNCPQALIFPPLETRLPDMYSTSALRWLHTFSEHSQVKGNQHDLCLMQTNEPVTVLTRSVKVYTFIPHCGIYCYDEKMNSFETITARTGASLCSHPITLWQQKWANCCAFIDRNSTCVGNV